MLNDHGVALALLFRLLHPRFHASLLHLTLDTRTPQRLSGGAGVCCCGTNAAVTVYALRSCFTLTPHTPHACALQCSSLCDANGPDCCCDPDAVMPLTTTIVDNSYSSPQGNAGTFTGFFGYNYSSHVVTFVPPVVTTPPMAEGTNYTRTMTYNVCMTGNNRKCSPLRPNYLPNRVHTSYCSCSQ
jgi:hypothetical protein